MVNVKIFKPLSKNTFYTKKSLKLIKMRPDSCSRFVPIQHCAGQPYEVNWISTVPLHSFYSNRYGDSKTEPNSGKT